MKPQQPAEIQPKIVVPPFTVLAKKDNSDLDKKDDTDSDKKEPRIDS